MSHGHFLFGSDSNSAPDKTSVDLMKAKLSERPRDNA
ncbi:hypothetical protein R3I94_019864 [Phoxinus phoxinus]